MGTLKCVVDLVVLRGLSPISIGAALIIKWMKDHHQECCRIKVLNS